LTCTLVQLLPSGDMSATGPNTAIDVRTGAAPVAHLDDLAIGSPRLVRVDGRKVCLVRTESGVHAVDATCPHEGYGLTQGSVDGDVLTCEWHNWKFRLSDGRCLRGEEDVIAHDVVVDESGDVTVALHEPEPAAERARLRASLRTAIEHDRLGQISRDVVRLLRASDDPGELVWEAVAYGAPRHEYGWGHSIAAATDCLAMVALHDGDERALPVVQAIAGISETNRPFPPRPLPAPAPALPVDAAGAFRQAVEREDLEGAQALVLAGLEAGLGTDELHRWFTGPLADHHLSYGHGAIYSQKAFQLLDALGADRAATVLPHLVPALVWGTREDLLPYMRRFQGARHALDLEDLAEREVDPGWRDDGRLVAALLGADKGAPVAAAADALREGAGVHGLLDAVVEAVSLRMLRYDAAGEYDLEDDFGWLDITHGLTYANAARWHHERHPVVDSLRLALHCVFLAHWTGRHEWHTRVAPPLEPRHGDVGLRAALLRGDEAGALGAIESMPVAEAGDELQRAALLDRTTAPIVHAHAVKTSRVAAEEAVRTGSRLPLGATARFLAGPRLERFVAATVTRSIDFVAGRVDRG